MQDEVCVVRECIKAMCVLLNSIPKIVEDIRGSSSPTGRNKRQPHSIGEDGNRSFICISIKAPSFFFLSLSLISITLLDLLIPLPFINICIYSLFCSLFNNACISLRALNPERSCTFFWYFHSFHSPLYIPPIYKNGCIIM